MRQAITTTTMCIESVGADMACGLQGELWQLPASAVRRGHPAEREGYGLLKAAEVRCSFSGSHM